MGRRRLPVAVFLVSSAALAVLVPVWAASHFRSAMYLLGARDSSLGVSVMRGTVEALRLVHPGLTTGPRLEWSAVEGPAPTEWESFVPGITVRPQAFGRIETLRIPLWIPTALAATGAFLTRGCLRVFPAGHCPACGYDLRASEGRCPECGRGPTPTGRP